MSISTLRRQVKNVAYNFSDAQVKVREATSNDPWGPTTALMSEIADLTHNPMSFTEIMSMLWKRLNDHGKNWRHVYKSLVLLDYLIKCGSEKVAQQCRENIYSIETLKDFQHIEDNRDQGLNVREKAKQMVALLHDEERLKNERARFLLTRKRFIQNGAAISSDGTTRTMRRAHDTALTDSEFEEARPSSLGEEEMQLQIAMALSREECEKEEELRKGDAIRLQIALEESQREQSTGTQKDSTTNANGQKMISSTALSQSALEDLLSMGLGDPTNISQAPSTSAQAYGNSVIDPWSPRPSGSTSASAGQSLVYPTLLPSAAPASLAGSSASNDPWAPAPGLPSYAAATAQPQHLPADVLLPSLSTSTSNDNGMAKTNGTTSPLNDPWAAFEASQNNGSLNAVSEQQKAASQANTPNMDTNSIGLGQQRPNVKTPETFLGENSALVNLDNLMGPVSSMPAKPAANPFMLGSSSNSNPTNPFAAQQRPSPSLHEMMHAQRSGGPNTAQSTSAAPTQPPRPSTNPFAL